MRLVVSFDETCDLMGLVVSSKAKEDLEDY